jgi:acyl-CoA hydrolase
MSKIKTPDDSKTTMTEVVFPNDTNPMGIVQGGRIIQLMDIACAITAQTHSGKIAVTASIDKVSFKQPARLGDILTIKAKITRAFNTSMEIHVEVWSKRLPEMKPIQTNDAYFVFVALDEKAKPAAVMPVKPTTTEEKEQYIQALKRRKNRIG